MTRLCSTKSQSLQKWPFQSQKGGEEHCRIKLEKLYKTQEIHLSVVTATSAVSPYGIYFCLCERYPSLIRLAVPNAGTACGVSNTQCNYVLDCFVQRSTQQFSATVLLGHICESMKRYIQTICFKMQFCKVSLPNALPQEVIHPHKRSSGDTGLICFSHYLDTKFKARVVRLAQSLRNTPRQSQEFLAFSTSSAVLSFF